MRLDTLPKKEFFPFIRRAIYRECELNCNTWIEREQIAISLLQDPDAGEIIDTDYLVKVNKDGKSRHRHSDSIESWTRNIVDWFSREYTKHQNKNKNKDVSFLTYFQEFERRYGKSKDKAAYKLRESKFRSIQQDQLLDKRVDRSHVIISKTFEQLSLEKEFHERLGRMGEEMVCSFLEARKLEGQIYDFEWTSDSCATAPYDFKVIDESRSILFIDVKSTTASFGRPFYLSGSEIKFIIGKGISDRYKICRVYDMDESFSRARMRFSEEIDLQKDNLSHIFTGLPAGLDISSIRVNPNYFSFGQKIWSVSIE